MNLKQQIENRIRAEYNKYKDSSYVDWVKVCSAKIAGAINIEIEQQSQHSQEREKIELYDMVLKVIEDNSTKYSDMPDDVDRIAVAKKMRNFILEREKEKDAQLQDEHRKYTYYRDHCERLEKELAAEKLFHQISKDKRDNEIEAVKMGYERECRKNEALRKELEEAREQNERLKGEREKDAIGNKTDVMLSLFDTMKFIDWASVKSYKRCINGEWIQTGTGDYKTVARDTIQLYEIYENNRSKKTAS